MKGNLRASDLMFIVPFKVTSLVNNNKQRPTP
jgi:hypothetical protein